MKKNILKHIYIVLLSIPLLVSFFYFLPPKSNPTISFVINSTSLKKEIIPYTNEAGEYLVFLPSFLDLSNVTIDRNGNTVLFNGKFIDDNFSFSTVKLQTKYDISINGEDKKIQFLKSSNVATLFVDTVSKSMRQIDNNKKYKELSDVVLIGSDGYCDFSDDSCTINSRGNATWESTDKKSYVLSLPSNDSLLGMKESLKWVLLANSFDSSNINNKLVFDLANSVGMDGTPECEFVDVYLNGSYNGLYLMTTKIEYSADELGLNISQGDFICKTDLNERFEGLNNPFESYLNRSVEISVPSNPSENQKSKIENLVNKMEQMIALGEFSNDSIKIDIDSWVCKYLIDEISANVDADLASNYFYFKNGVFYAGPVWDYDIAFGLTQRNVDPYSFVAKSHYKLTDNYSAYYSNLYKNETFKTRMIQIYKEVFLPEIQNLINGGIELLADSIDDATCMDNIRWGTDSDLSINNHDAKSIVRYLEKRIDFLNSAWVDGEEYCTVIIQHSSGDFVSHTLKRGEFFDPYTIFSKDKKWVDVITGEMFDFLNPIDKDVALAMVDLPQNHYSKQEIISFFSFLLIVLAVCAFVCFEIKQKVNKKGN